MLLDDQAKLLWEVKLGAPHNSEVRSCSLLESDRNFKLLELLVVHRVLHLSQNDAFLHLANVFLFDHSHQMLEGIVNLIRIKFVALSHAL